MLNFEPPEGTEPWGNGDAAKRVLPSLTTRATQAPGAPGAGDNGGDAGPLLLQCLVQSLDHVGRGMLLVGPAGGLLHANRLAQAALATAGHALRAEQGRVTARHLRDQPLLASAIEAALHKGVRRLLTLGRGADEAPAPADDDTHSSGATGAVTLAVLPIGVDLGTAGAAGSFGTSGASSAVGAGQPLRAQAVLISLPQCSHSKNLAVTAFAREHGCTDAEELVLQALLAGHTPEAIALQRKVQLCTVRTQIGQLRLKTGSRTIRALLDRVAALPPMMVVLQ